MSLSVFLDGETVVSKGYGKRDIEKGLDANQDTLFSIGSISKSFIATLIVKTLSEKYPTYGEAILDVPISQLNPNFNNFNFTFSDRFRSEQISFRDLLSHRTCLFGADMGLLFGTMRKDRENNYRNRYQSQASGHKSSFVNNNALYALVGEIIASFEGKTLEELARNFMLEIGMQNSTTIDTSASYEDLPKDITGSKKLNLANISSSSLSIPNLDLENVVGLKLGITEINSDLADNTDKVCRIEFEDVIGVYGEKSTGDLTITLDAEDNSFLQLNMNGEWGIGRLIPINGSETKFVVDWKTEI